MRARIALLILAVLAALPAAEAQPTGKVYRIAFVHPSVPVAEMTELAREGRSAFISELRRLGYIEGKNLIVDRRSGEGHTERYTDLAREVVQTKPDVIVAVSTPLVRRFKM
jgi:putative tryptophan/tyrosine transport system substrate-binding protein